MKYHSNSTQQPLVIWGASGHARVVTDIVRLIGKFNIIGFLDNIDPGRCGKEFCGALILGGQEQLGQLRSNDVKYLIFGLGDCLARLTLSSVSEQLGFELATAIHPNATVAGDVAVGRGTHIGPGAHLGGGVTIGQGTWIGICAIIKDRIKIGKNVIVGAGAVVLKDIPDGVVAFGVPAKIVRDKE